MVMPMPLCSDAGRIPSVVDKLGATFSIIVVTACYQIDDILYEASDINTVNNNAFLTKLDTYKKERLDLLKHGRLHSNTCNIIQKHHYLSIRAM